MSAVIAAAAVSAVGAIGGAAISSHAAGKAASEKAAAATEAAKIQAAAADKASASQLSMYNQTRSDLNPFMVGGSNAFGILANIFGFGGGSNATATAAFGAPTTVQPQPQQLTPEQRQGAKIDPNTGQITGYTDPTTGQFVAGSADPNTGMFTPTAQPGQTSPLAAGQGQPNPQLATDLLTKFPGYQFGLEQGEQALNRTGAAGGRYLSGAQMQDAMKFGTGYAMQQAWNPFISELNFATTTGSNAASSLANAGSNTAKGIAETTLAAGEAGANGILGAGNANASGTAAGGAAWGGAFSQLGQIGKGALSSYANDNGNNWNPVINTDFSNYQPSSKPLYGNGYNGDGTYSYSG